MLQPIQVSFGPINDLPKFVEGLDDFRKEQALAQRW
jgi:hypothetical protein